MDFSAATDAGLTPALSLATELGAELVLLHVLNFPYPQVEHVSPTFDLDSYYETMEAEARRSLEDLTDVDTRRFAPASVQVHRGIPHVFQPDSILFATDFSRCADEAQHEAVSLAIQYGAALTLLHVVTLWENDPANPAWRFPAVPDEYRTSVIDVAAEQLASRRDRCTSDALEVDTLLVRGFDPAAEIVQAARETINADLVVVGTHGHTGLAHVLLGSTAEKVVRLLDGPVLTIRATEAQATA